jgi:hypothetical protein
LSRLAYFIPLASSALSAASKIAIAHRNHPPARDRRSLASFLLSQRRGQVVERRGHVEVIGAKQFPLRSQRAAIKTLGLACLHWNGAHTGMDE